VRRKPASVDADFRATNAVKLPPYHCTVDFVKR
jgi:hypothetical protein